MGAIQAARMGDQVGGHASTLKGWLGFAAGLALGAAVGAALIFFAPVVVGIGAVAAGLAMASAVTGAVALAATGAMVVGRWAHTFDAPAVKGGSPCGAIVKGLETVKIEHMQAARQSDPVSHSGAQMRQGSATVLMRKLPASRNEDLSSCTGKVIKPATYTFIGGPAADNGKSSSASLFDDALAAAAFTAKWAGYASMAFGAAAGFVGGGLVAGIVATAKMGAIWAGSTLLLTPALSKLGDMQDRAEGHGGHEAVQSYAEMVADNAVDQWDGAKAVFGFDADAKARAAKAAADARADGDDPAAHRWKDFYGGMSSFVTVGILEGAGKIKGMFGKSAAEAGAEAAVPPKPPAPEGEPPPIEVTPPEPECTTCKGSGAGDEPPVPETPPAEESTTPAEDPPPPPPEDPPPPKPPEDAEEVPEETPEEAAARKAVEDQQYADGEKFFQQSLKDNPPKTPEAQAIAEAIKNGKLRVQLLDSDAESEGGFRPPDDPNETPTIQIRNQGRAGPSKAGTTESMYHEGTHYQQWLEAGKPSPEAFQEYYEKNFAWMEVEAEVNGRNSRRGGPPSDELIAHVKGDFLQSYIDQFGDPPPGYRESNEIRPSTPPKCPTCEGADEAPPATEIVQGKATDIKDVYSQADADPSIIYDGSVFRGDSRSPAQLKAANGFAGHDPNTAITLQEHLMVNRRQSHWISTTKDADIGAQYARDPFPVGQPPRTPFDMMKQSGYVYQIGKTGGVDVDAGSSSGAIGNHEVAYSDPIQWTDVHSYAEVKPYLNADGTTATNPDGSAIDHDNLTWVKNPDYTGPKLPGDP